MRAHTCPTRCHPVNPTARYRATISRVEACAVLPDGRERLVACGSEAFVGLGLTRRQAEQAAAAEVQAWFVAKGLWDPATVEGPPPPNIGLVNIPVPGMHTRVRILQSCTRVRACASRSASWRTAAFGQAVLCMHCCMSMLVAGQQPPCAQPATLQSPTVHIFPLSEWQTRVANRHRVQSRLRHEDNPLVALTLQGPEKHTEGACAPRLTRTIALYAGATDVCASGSLPASPCCAANHCKCPCPHNHRPPGVARALQTQRAPGRQGVSHNVKEQYAASRRASRSTGRFTSTRHRATSRRKRVQRAGWRRIRLRPTVGADGSGRHARGCCGHY